MSWIQPKAFRTVLLVDESFTEKVLMFVNFADLHSDCPFQREAGDRFDIACRRESPGQCGTHRHEGKRGLQQEAASPLGRMTQEAWGGPAGMLQTGSLQQLLDSCGEGYSGHNFPPLRGPPAVQYAP